MKRRSFLKGIAAGTAATSLTGGLGILRKAHARQKVDIGQIKGLTVEVLSETSWFDNAIFKKNIMDYGGSMTNQYTIPWDWDNAGGYMTKITVEPLEGEPKVLLMDTGWNNGWVDYIYDEKSDMGKLLTSGKVDTMILSHWHLDHYWGIESTLKRNPKITMYAPKTYFPEDMKLLKGGKNVATTKDGKEVMINQNSVPHQGKLVLTDPKGEKGETIYRLMDGVAVKMFDVPILLRVRGENVMYFNVKDKGVVTVTGCCPPRHSDPQRLGPAQCGGLQTLRLLWWVAHQPV
jgi:7,8-dihydropterin-6-yl-methyl-4-(beta-D-ribofuranosyl)aminobenzene 5'-phosphate synthase